MFDKIIEADPTTVLKDSKMGVYCKWLLKLYSNGKLLIEDLYKATNYLSAFHQFKHKISNRDINSYKSLSELFKVVEPFLEKEDVRFENDAERKLAGQFKEVFRNNEYRIIIPLTLKASQYFGQGTEWCTTNTNMFKKYTKKQNGDEILPYNLYILYTENLDDRIQFHFKSRQFMDKYDNKIGILEFFDYNKDIYDFFNKHFKVDKYYLHSDIKWTRKTMVGAPIYADDNFYCSAIGLKSLVGSPQTVDGYFDCSFNELVNLNGSPTITTDFYCGHNRLVNLIGAPQTVDGDFNCKRNELINLVGVPQTVGGDFYCNGNKKLSKNDIMRYYKTGAVKGTIHSDYGEFRQAK